MSLLHLVECAASTSHSHLPTLLLSTVSTHSHPLLIITYMIIIYMIIVIYIVIIIYMMIICTPSSYQVFQPLSPTAKHQHYKITKPTIIMCIRISYAKSNLKSTDANLAPKKFAPNLLQLNSQEADLFGQILYSSPTQVIICAPFMLYIDL